MRASRGTRIDLARGGRVARRGLTLIELLVVIAVLSILIGLLFPSLRSMREAGRSAMCASNVRQMAVAVNQYAVTYRYYPVATRWSNDGGTYTTHEWDFIKRESDVEPGAMWAFLDGPTAVHQCPSYVGPEGGGGGGPGLAPDPFTGYNYNTSYIGGEAPYGADWNHPDFRPSLRFGACRRCATTAMFGDAGRAGGTNKFMRSPLSLVEGDLPTAYAGGQAFRHMGRTNVAYLDGHVSSVADPRRGANATEALLDTLGYPDNGFLSDDDRTYDPR